MPFTYSTDGGASFAKGSTGKGFKLPFPALGGNQRPCVHRLLSGSLVFVGTHRPNAVITMMVMTTLHGRFWLRIVNVHDHDPMGFQPMVFRLRDIIHGDGTSTQVRS